VGCRSLIRRYEGRTNFPPLQLYALCEMLIGISALLVPLQIALGPSPTRTNRWSKRAFPPAVYYLVAGAWLALT